MLREFKEFAMRGNVVDMAVGVIIGGAFGAIAKSLISDILMPAIGLLLGGADFSNLFVVIKDGKTAGPYPTLAEAQAAGAVTINYGAFLNTVISFLIVAFAVFLVVKSINAMRRKQEEAVAETKECEFCASSIPIKAKRCPQCTSQFVNL
jgi:large conductance mechanosensitive channel